MLTIDECNKIVNFYKSIITVIPVSSSCLQKELRFKERYTLLIPQQAPKYKDSFHTQSISFKHCR